MARILPGKLIGPYYPYPTVVMVTYAYQKALTSVVMLASVAPQSNPSMNRPVMMIRKTAHIITSTRRSTASEAGLSCTIISPAATTREEMVNTRINSS